MNETSLQSLMLPVMIATDQAGHEARWGRKVIFLSFVSVLYRSES